MARTLALAFGLVFLASAWAGCVLVRDGAPLVVPSVAHGDHVVQTTHLTGHHETFEFTDDEQEPVKITFEPMDIHQTYERRVSAVPDSVDAFGRVFKGTGIVEESTGGEFLGDEIPSIETADVFEDASKVRQYEDLHVAIRVQGQTHSLTVRLYDRGGPAADRDLLSGATLRLGTPVYRDLYFNASDGQYHFQVSWLPVEETRIGGQRAFRLEPGPVRVLEQPPAPTRTWTPPTGTRQEPMAPRPQSSYSVWYAANCPYPVREESHFPFSHEGQWYWRNQTTETSTCTAGTDVVNWNRGAPLDALALAPGAHLVGAREFFSSSNTGLQYSIANAWANIRADPTLTKVQAILAQNPAAFPIESTYVPDPANHAYTWTLRIGEDQGGAQGASSRLQAIAAPLPTFHQDREETVFAFQKPANQSAMDSTKVVTLADALRAYRTLRPGTTDPAVKVDMTGPLFDAGQARFDATFASATIPASVGVPLGPLALGGGRWVAGAPATVDLMDGGLRGINITSLSGGPYQWPWLGIPWMELPSYLSCVGAARPADALVADLVSEPAGLACLPTARP